MIAKTIITDRRCVEWTLAFVLLFAAATKAYSFLVNPNQAAEGIPGGQPVLVALVEIESILGTWLLVGGFSRARFFSAFICFAFFEIVTLNDVIHAVPTCGCFGEWKVPPTITAVLDFVASISLWLTRPRLSTSDNWRPFHLNRGIGVLLLLAITSIMIADAAASRVSSRADTTFDPASWLNRPFVLLNRIEGSSELRHGRWFIVFYHYGCEDCRRAIPTYIALAAIMRGDPDEPRISFVAIPPYAAVGQDPVLPSLDYLHLNLRDDGSWFAATPVVVALEDGKVLAITDGENALMPPDVFAWHGAN